MPILAGKADGKELPDLVRFIGHFHPVLLHLPIGVFMLILCQELGAIFFRRGRDRDSVSLFPMFFGVASAILAVIAGFLLFHGDTDDYAGNTLAERHLWSGLVFAVAAVLTFLLKAWTVACEANPAWYRLMLFASVGVMGFASHDGASITHGSDFLTKYAPDPLREILGLGAAKKESKAAHVTGVYGQIVVPILERRCLDCHQESKSKGKLRMDSYELLMHGGKSGPVIIAGDAVKSEMIARMELPEDDDEHMPPAGKPAVEDAELVVLRWWINQGADPAKTLKDFEVPTEISGAIAKLPAAMPTGKGTVSTGHPGPAKPVAAGPDDALKKSVADLTKQFPGALAFESQESSLVTFTAVSLRGKLDDEGFRKFAPVLSQLVTADLSATQITDRSVIALEAAKNLRQLRLAETSVTDASMDTLLKLPTLESINLYGTKVTDAGVMKLAALPNLKHLYLWQTPVKPETIKALQEKLPKCEIIMGS